MMEGVKVSEDMVLRSMMSDSAKSLYYQYQMPQSVEQLSFFEQPKLTQEDVQKMPYRPAITYRYDLPLDGLFTCLMESYQKKKSWQKSFRRYRNKPGLLPCREIQTDCAAAQRA